MCCEDAAELNLPPAVIEMLARYRRLRDEQGYGWGEEALPDFFRWARFSRLGPAFAEFAASGDWAGAVRAVTHDVPAGLVVVSLTDAGLSARTGPPRLAIADGPVHVDVVLDSTLDHDAVVTVAGTEIPVAASGVGLCTLETPDFDVAHGGEILSVTGAVTPTPTAWLRLHSQNGARWSIVDATGGAWFAAGVPHKWDAADQPFFHTEPGKVTVAVPAGPLRVTAARGLEFERQRFEPHPTAGETVNLEYVPVRRFDPAATGWYGADLHVHLNYSGDHVLHPADAARMQRGEGLHLMHLAAGNLGGSLVYDLELLESTAGTNLWNADGTVARAGLEFRNDLLGHVHGLGLTGVPDLLHTGHEGTDHPWDWPPNTVACARLREHGAVTTYAHPVFAPGTDPDDLFRPYRMVEARELIADAALGVVDAIELVSCFDDHGALVLYHHLLSCGLRLTATAGTDTFLSFAHGPATASNPPGWGRVYAQLDRPLGVEAFTDAIRAGRTLVTNGPWLTFDVAGHGPGATLDAARGDHLTVSVRAAGSGIHRLVLYGPDGELATTTDDTLDHTVVVESGTWLAAAAHGEKDPYTVGAPVFAHTTPVYVNVAGNRVARQESATWCLSQLDTLAELVTRQGRFAPAHRDTQLADFTDLLDQARTFYRAITD